MNKYLSNNNNNDIPAKSEINNLLFTEKSISESNRTDLKVLTKIIPLYHMTYTVTRKIKHMSAQKIVIRMTLTLV